VEAYEQAQWEKQILEAEEDVCRWKREERLQVEEARAMQVSEEANKTATKFGA
jgi:hypothetical protein